MTLCVWEEEFIKIANSEKIKIVYCELCWRKVLCWFRTKNDVLIKTKIKYIDQFLVLLEQLKENDIEIAGVKYTELG